MNKDQGKISLVILAMVTPFLLIPIEIMLPWPSIIEELLKFLMIRWWTKVIKTKKNDWTYALMAGIMFAVSESILYSDKIMSLGKWWFMPERLILTVAMHSTTMLLILFGVKKGKVYGLLALLGAIVIHESYNYLAISL